MNLSKSTIKAIRSWALKFAEGYGYSAAPVELEAGKSPPRWEGGSYHWENKSGDIIEHPSAYMAAWGKPIYIASTRRIIVGIDWVQALEARLTAVHTNQAL